jgi:hypothetical protein
MSLPTTGESNWGTQLNNYITSVVLAQANTATSAITTHQAASDPHGDKAYALALVAPLTTGVNQPNGLLQLNNIGKIPTGQLPPGGGRTSTFDVVKDYAAPTNGTDATTQIQNALNDCGTAGGGEVWVGDGNFGYSLPFYVQPGTWLHLSPGATMTRLVNAGSGLAPAYAVTNFNGSVSSTGAGNIVIEGGSWIFDSQTAAGIPMAFVNGTNILIRNTSIRTLAGSPAVMAAGCTVFDTSNILYSTATPASGRSAYISAPPAVRIETSASTVISGLNSAMYTNSPCSMVAVRNSSITGGTASDGMGLYTAFGGIAGTTAAVANSFHNNVIVTGNNAVALPYNGVYAVNWQTATVSGNQFNLNDGSAAAVSWSPSAPASTNQVIVNNGASDSLGTSVTAYKSASTSRSSTTTRTLDPDLQLPVLANAVYEVRAAISYACNSTSAGLAFDFQIPSGASMIYAGTEANASSGSAGIYELVAGTPDNVSTGGSGNNLALQVMGILKVGGTAGTMGFLWAQFSSSGSALSLQALSYLTLTRVA